MAKDLYTTGEFAKLCGVSKDTLFFYDQQGVLKPAITRQNGYRYYHATQLFLFNLITDLNESGVSLKEIKNCFDYRDLPEYLDVLEGSLQHLHQKELHLKQSINYLTHLLDVFKDNDFTNRDEGDNCRMEFRLEYQEQRAFKACAVCSDIKDLSVFTLAMNKTLRTARCESSVDRLNPFIFMPQQVLVDGTMEEAMFCIELHTEGSRIPGQPMKAATIDDLAPIGKAPYDSIAEGYVLERPSGIYLTLSSRGNLKQLPESYEALRKHVHERHYNTQEGVWGDMQFAYQPKQRRLSAQLDIPNENELSAEDRQVAELNERFGTVLDVVLRLSTRILPDKL